MQDIKTKSHRHKQQYDGYQMEGVGGIIKGKQNQICGDADDMTLGSGTQSNIQVMQY